MATEISLIPCARNAAFAAARVVCKTWHFLVAGWASIIVSSGIFDLRLALKTVPAYAGGLPLVGMLGNSTAR
ncbi:MAG: hypothetical protein ACOH1J_03205 [Microbacteriaceae bacterium]